ncbi:MAG: patatin-like phospholipase family protein, partial [Burkholderiales bacterium]
MRIEPVVKDSVCVDHVLEQERTYLGLPSSHARAQPGPEAEDLAAAATNNAPWALCLSGGGIRSATFALGVLQGLAQRKLLSRFHYLSTVSGGGYIGSWLSRWIREANGDVAAVQATLAGSTEPAQVRHLRSYSNYLSPVLGLSTDAFSLVSIFLRNLILNWAILLPLLLAVVLVPRLYLSLAMSPPASTWVNAMLWASALLIAAGIAYVVADLPPDETPDEKGRPKDHFQVLCFLPILLGAACVALVANWHSALANWEWRDFALAGAALHLVGCVAGMVWRPCRGIGALPSGGSSHPIAAATADLVMILTSGAVGGVVVYWLVQLPASGLLQHCSQDQIRLLTAVFAVPALLFCFWLTTTVYVALTRCWTTEADREWWARSGAWWLRACLGWILGFGLIIYLPQWIFEIPGISGTSLAAGGSLLGMI